MAHLEINFVVPIALLGASLLGVLLVRFAAEHGERAAKKRARRLIDELGPDAGNDVMTGHAGGMRAQDSASTS